MTQAMLNCFKLEEATFPSLRYLYFEAQFHIEFGEDNSVIQLLDQKLLPIIRGGAERLEHLSIILRWHDTKTLLLDICKLLPDLPTLKSLYLRGKLIGKSSQESGTIRKLLVDYLPRLKELFIARSHKHAFSDGAASLWALQAPHLTSLKLGINFEITEAFFIFLQEHMKQLQTFWISSRDWKEDSEHRFLTLMERIQNKSLRDLFLHTINQDPAQLLGRIQSAFPELHFLRIQCWHTAFYTLNGKIMMEEVWTNYLFKHKRFLTNT
jgi:hypothetical protein